MVFGDSLTLNGKYSVVYINLYIKKGRTFLMYKQTTNKDIPKAVYTLK